MPKQTGSTEKALIEQVQKKISAAAAEDATQEIPETKPFEGHSYIKKTWTDTEDGVERVLLNVALGHMNRPPNWEKTEVYEMMPEWGTLPLQRGWVIRIPTHFEGEEKYLLHYFFVSHYKDGTECISQNYTELISPRFIQFVDHSGLYTHVKLHWSLDNWAYPQNTELEFEGIEWGSEYSVSRSPYRQGDRLYERGRAGIIMKAPTPRIFRGIIWGPHKEKVDYCFNLITIDQTGKLVSKWDNNEGLNYKLTI